MKGFKTLLIGLIVVVAILILSQFVFQRWDMTEDGRYSFSEVTKEVVSGVKEPIQIDVYLTGELTGNFRVLKNEIQFFLNEIHRKNKNISYRFVDALDKKIPIDSLYAKGVYDVSLPTNEKILRIFPYATIRTKNKEIAVSLLSNKKVPMDERALVSIDNIEPNFVREIYQVTQTKKKKIGLMVHHDELLPNYLNGFMNSLSEEYQIEPFTQPILDSSYTLKNSDLPALEKYDALVVAKPVKPFSQEDKLVLDQYVMNGGKMLWMLESVDAEMDSLFRSDKIITFPRELNLNDYFFTYGLRIMPSIVKDLQSGYIALGIGDVGTNSAYEMFPWPYFPASISIKNHPINRKLDNPIRFEFCNPIEILERDSIQQTVLLATSHNVQLQKPLSYIDFSEVQKTTSENYPTQSGVYPLAILVEGKLPSAFAGRFESTEFPDYKSSTRHGKIMVISDGDFAKNHVFRGQPLPLGADKYSMRPDMKVAPSVLYDNARFISNALDYLTGNENLLSLNNKERSFHQLDKTKIDEQQSLWRWLNMMIPLALIWLVGIVLMMWRKWKFGK